MKKILFIALAVFTMAACSTKVERMDVNTTKDLSGKWNDTDSRLVSEKMITACLSAQWYAKTAARLGKAPVVIVGTVENKSMEHINTGTFIEDMQRSLINSTKVEFVASAAERGEVRTERLEQDEFASEATRKAFGKEVGADFMLSGVLNSILDQEGKRNVIFYQVNLKLIDLETNKIVWNGQEQIKKYVLKRGSSW